MSSQIKMKSISKDIETTNMLNFFKFFSDKSKTVLESSAADSASNSALGKDSSAFVRARNVLISNPFHLEPITETESMEDVLAIKNKHELQDQMR